MSTHQYRSGYYAVGEKVGKFLFWALVTALRCCLTYMVFVHRKVINATIKGESLAERPEGKCRPRF